MSGFDSLHLTESLMNIETHSIMRHQFAITVIFKAILLYIALDKRDIGLIFFLFLHIVVLIRGFLMNTYNICFCGEINSCPAE